MIIREERERREISFLEFAQMLNIDKSFLSKIETGKKKPNQQLAQKISEILKIDIHKIYLSQKQLDIISQAVSSLSEVQFDKFLSLIKNKQTFVNFLEEYDSNCDR